MLQLLSQPKCRKLKTDVNDIAEIDPEEKILSIESLTVDALPDWISQLKKSSCLETLKLAFQSKLSEFPMIIVELSEVKSLTSLDLSGTIFNGKVPKQLGELKSLRSLNFSKCKIEIMDEAFFQQSTALNILNLHDNNIQSFPASLFCLPRLVELDISLTHGLKALPPKLILLTSLTSLNLSQNNFQRIEDDILIYLVNLKKISIAKNVPPLVVVPPQLGNLPKLEEVDVTGNEIKWPKIRRGPSYVAEKLKKYKVFTSRPKKLNFYNEEGKKESTIYMHRDKHLGKLSTF